MPNPRSLRFTLSLVALLSCFASSCGGGGSSRRDLVPDSGVSPTPTPTASATPTPGASPTPAPTASPTIFPTPAPTPIPTPFPPIVPSPTAPLPPAGASPSPSPSPNNPIPGVPTPSPSPSPAVEEIPFDPSPQDPTGNNTLRWNRTNLTYFIAAYSAKITRESQRTAIRAAFDAWQNVSPLRFTQASSIDNADIVIGFGTGNHCELYEAVGAPCTPDATFDADTLAHAYFPGFNRSIDGDCHINDDYTARFEPGRLKEILMHELGHSLGVEHQNDPNAIMYYAAVRRVKTGLNQTDIAAIQRIYGAN